MGIKWKLKTLFIEKEMTADAILKYNNEEAYLMKVTEFT